MDAIQELQMLKEALIQEIDRKIGQVIEKLNQQQAENQVETAPSPQGYESIYSLNIGTGVFKGKRPIAVLFADGRRIETPTWKKVMEVILVDCYKQLEKRQMLLDLRGKVLGRNRVLLGSEKGTMRSPVKIAEALYVESHYDTETLLRILTTRILNPIDYNYSGIKLAIQTESCSFH